MISILIPLYNGIEFIGDSVYSVMNQTFTDWELIIAVNGHPENSVVYSIAKQFETPDKKIRVYDFHTIEGKANTLNEMLNYCNYEFIGLLDVDDIWLPEKLEKQMMYLKGFRYDVVGSRCVYFGDKENIIPAIPVGDISSVDFRRVNPIINSSSIMRKCLCHWVENGLEDYDLWLRLRYKRERTRFFNFKEVLVKHRIHKKSAFNSKGNHMKVSDLLKEYQT